MQKQKKRCAPELGHAGQEALQGGRVEVRRLVNTQLVEQVARRDRRQAGASDVGAG